MDPAHFSDLCGQWLLADIACLHFTGRDARAFLHAQLTQSVQDLEPGQARPAAYCTAQGRLLANGMVWATHEPDALYLMVASDLASGLQQRMQRYVMRADVRIVLDGTLPIMAARGHEHVPERLHAAPSWSVQSDDKGWWVSGPDSCPALPSAWHVSHTAAPEEAMPQADDAAAWRASRLLAGWPMIRAATQGMFLPAALNMDLNGTIHFQKGCYPGQEIIARSHYRGTAKRRLAVGSGPWPDSGAEPAAGTDLFVPGGSDRPAARLIEACIWNGRLYAAAEALVADGPSLWLAPGHAQAPALDLHMA
ncbi:folate-binding protein YgfZ [Castellaniella sp.]|uniref:CAF17-like 4Fe-4S cluster assembly/insertion protein YgfZ n=1 Tax=Castellaniella sp. TaxID=1955812 RepID=UPI003560F5A6